MYQPPNEPSWQPDPYQQQPPTQYPPYQQPPYSQPGYSTQQRPYYQPPYYQPPPVMFVQQLPSPKRHNGCLIAVAVLIALAIFGTIVNAVSGTQSSTTTTATSTPQPSPAPSAQPSQYTTSPLIGSDISVFLAAYGEPDMIDSGIDYVYYAQGIVASVGVNSVQKHVKAVLVSPAPGMTWAAGTAKTACLPYMPSDARFKHTLMIYGKKHVALYYEFVYFSPSLIKQLPASDFIDQNFKRDKPGTFVLALGYVLGSTTAFDSCFVDASMQ